MSLVRLEWQLIAEVKKEGDWIIASFSPLDVHSQGRTIEEAIGNLRGALSLFVESCYEAGVLEEVLREAGFHAAPDAAPEKPAEHRHLLKVPLKLASDHAPCSPRAWG